MQTFTLTIVTENAAFEDAPELEVARILREVADDLTEGRDFSGGCTLRDANGNKTGTAEATE